MMTQILACCKYCGAQSMWYDVVNNIPCLVKWAFFAILLIFLFKYVVEWFKVYYEFKANHSKTIDELRREKKELENSLAQQKIANVENKTREELQVLKDIAKQRETLWKSYKERMEELYGKCHNGVADGAESAGE